MNRNNLKKSNSSLKKRPIKRKPRKKSVLEKRKRQLFLKRVFLILVCLLLIFAALFGINLLLSKIFAVKIISIEGNSDYTESEIISASDIHIGDSLLFLNSKSSENKIYKSFTNIDGIHVSKKFPNKVRIVLEKASPKYWLRSENEYFIISENKKLLEKTSEMPENLIGISGLDFEIKETNQVEFKNNELENLIKEILGSFEGKGLNEVKEINISDMQNITVNYGGRITINIGNNEDIDYKILTSKEIINDKISKAEKGVLNLKNLKSENRTYFTYE